MRPQINYRFRIQFMFGCGWLPLLLLLFAGPAINTECTTVRPVTGPHRGTTLSPSDANTAFNHHHRSTSTGPTLDYDMERFEKYPPQARFESGVLDSHLTSSLYRSTSHETRHRLFARSPTPTASQPADAVLMSSAIFEVGNGNASTDDNDDNSDEDDNSTLQQRQKHGSMQRRQRQQQQQKQQRRRRRRREQRTTPTQFPVIAAGASATSVLVLQAPPQRQATETETEATASAAKVSAADNAAVAVAAPQHHQHQLHQPPTGIAVEGAAAAGAADLWRISERASAVPPIRMETTTTVGAILATIDSDAAGFQSSPLTRNLGDINADGIDDSIVMNSRNTGDIAASNAAAAAAAADDLSGALQQSIGSNEQIIILSGGGVGDRTVDVANENIDNIVVEAMAVEKTNRRHDSRSSRDADDNDDDNNDDNDDDDIAGNFYTTTPSKPAVRRRSAAASAADADAGAVDLDAPKVLPLRPIIRGPYDDDGGGDGSAGHQVDSSVVYAEPHTEVQLNCDVDLDVVTSEWLKDGQLVHTTDRNSRPTDNRFIRELRGALTITNAMLEDDGKWLCQARNAQGYVENARPVKLVVLDRPKPPYLLIDSRRLDAGNIFVPVKENSELTLACISEGGNPKPTLSWEVLLSPGVDRHTQKTSADTLELQEIRSEREKNGIAVKSEAKLSAVYRAHHNARILCVMEHPTLKMRLNASILLDVQYTPSFAISRTPGFGYPLREGLEVSLKCDVDSNPPSTPMWQKDAGDTPIPQTGDGFLNFTSIRRENSGWYKCSSRHLNFQYSSIGYYLSVRYDSVDVTSEPLEQDISVAASHITPNKRPQLEVQLGGAVTLQCPQGSLGCWSHLDPVTAKLRGLGIGLTTPTGQFSLKDVVYQDAGVYKCIGQSVGTNSKKKVEVIHTIAVQVKGAPTVSTRNNTPVGYAGAPLHLSVEFCANPPAFAARWLHGDRIYTPGNQYGIDVLAYGVIDLPTPFCKEARLTYVHMHERVPRTFYFVVSSPGGVAETIFHVNFTHKHKVMSNSVNDDDDEELSEPEEIHFPVFGSGAAATLHATRMHSATMLVLFAMSGWLSFVLRSWTMLSTL